MRNFQGVVFIWTQKYFHMNTKRTQKEHMNRKILIWTQKDFQIFISAPLRYKNGVRKNMFPETLWVYKENVIYKEKFHL